jgi:serine/threonine protein kinase
LGVAVQLVEALASAHVSGVTHRDLKPANVMVDRDYGVKVLDFGLAKVTRQAVASSSIELSRDVITETGAILGTVPYMAPEQIQGKGADHRSDIFSLGVIMHEMAVGHRPFRGVTSAEIMASILRDEPESIATSRPDLPAPLARIIGRCLSKQPDRRYSSTKDLLRELEILR